MVDECAQFGSNVKHVVSECIKVYSKGNVANSALEEIDVQMQERKNERKKDVVRDQESNQRRSAPSRDGSRTISVTRPIGQLNALEEIVHIYCRWKTW